MIPEQGAVVTPRIVSHRVKECNRGPEESSKRCRISSRRYRPLAQRGGAREGCHWSSHVKGFYLLWIHSLSTHITLLWLLLSFLFSNNFKMHPVLPSFFSLPPLSCKILCLQDKHSCLLTSHFLQDKYSWGFG